jgi:hypothetical protein
MFNGVRVMVVPEEAVAVKKNRQFRFPKTKKKRILKKWAKRKENWRMEVVKNKENVVFFDGAMLVSQKMLDKLREEAAEKVMNNLSPIANN